MRTTSSSRSRAGALLLGLLAVVSLPPRLSAQQQPVANVSPVTDAMLVKPPPQDWLMWRRTLDSWGYSPLSQIDGNNVGQLQLVWSRGLEPGPQEGTPLIHDGVMYFPNARDVVQAFDAATGDLLWEHRRPQPADIEKYINAPFINRNLAIHEHLIIDTSADGRLYALDARTGKEVWETEVLNYRTGVHQTSGPLVAEGKVFSGRGCEPIPEAKPDYCVITAHDAKTGKELWRTRTIPGPGEKGNETWGDVPFGERKHVGAWMVPSYDPELRMIIIGTSVTSPAPKFLLSGNDRKYLYHNCTLAIDAQTGKIVWYYQHVVDHWDLDHTFERLLVDTEVTPASDAVAWINPTVRPGEKHQVVTGIPGKTGIVYTLDRRTGKFLWATPTVRQTVVKSIDGKTGEVTVSPDAQFSAKGDTHDVCPSASGGKNWPAGAYSPLTNTMYYPLANTCAEFAVSIASRAERSAYGFRTSGRITPGTQNVGAIHAISASTGRTAWRFEQRAALTSLVATGGGLLFGGDVAGRFRAIDQRTGEVLWQTNLGAQVTGFPVSYGIGDRQYIVASTGSSVNTAGTLVLTPEIRPSNNNAIFVFALPANWRANGAAGRTVIPQPAAMPVVVSSGVTPTLCRRTDARDAAEKSRSVAGHFSAAQSQQGRALYQQHCSLCHGESLGGAPGGPALADGGFRQAWKGRSLGTLFDCIKGSMPPGRGGTLPDDDYLRVLATILDANGYAAGGADARLTADPLALSETGL